MPVLGIFCGTQLATKRYSDVITQDRCFGKCCRSARIRSGIRVRASEAPAIVGKIAANAGHTDALKLRAFAIAVEKATTEGRKCLMHPPPFLSGAVSRIFMLLGRHVYSMYYSCHMGIHELR